MLRLLLLLSGFGWRQVIAYPGKVLERSRPAERCRPRELGIQVNEFDEVVLRELLIGDGPIDAGDDRTLTLCGGNCHAICGFLLKSSADFARDDASEAVGFFVGAVVRHGTLPLSSSGRHVHRPLLA